MLQVEITCSDPEVAYCGPWREGESPDDVLEWSRRKAVVRDMPVQVEIVGHGVWSITPDGRIEKGALFRRAKKGDR